MKKVSISTIAEHVKVSKTTVSFVLNGRGDEKKISRKTQKKIKEIADELGYKANHIARSLSLGNSRTIGFIVPNISDPFFSSFGKYVQKYAEDQGYSVLFSGTDESPDKENRSISNLVGRNVDGLILAPTQSYDTYPNNALLRQVPTIFFDRISDDQSHLFVDIDNYGASKDVTQILLDNNRNEIAIVSLTSYLPNIKQRVDGCIDAIKSAGYLFDESLFYEVDFNNRKDGVIQALNLMMSHQKKISAVFFVNNLLAAEGVWAMNMFHKNIIGSIEFACFDNLDIFDYSTPKVHSVIQPVEQMARSCVQQVCEKISTNISSKGERYQGKIVQR